MTGIYVRVKRNGVYENVEIEFLTPTELKEFLATKDEEWKDSLIGIILGDISRLEIALMGTGEENENRKTEDSERE